MSDNMPRVSTEEVTRAANELRCYRDNDTRYFAADMLQSLAAERDALTVELAEAQRLLSLTMLEGQ